MRKWNLNLRRIAELEMERRRVYHRQPIDQHVRRLFQLDEFGAFPLQLS